MDYSIILFLLIIIFLINIFTNSKKANERKEDSVIDSKQIDYTHYQKKNLLTKTEYAFYMKSKESLQEKNLYFYPKVRLEDFIETTGEWKDKQSYRSRIKSRHIDFLICDDKLHIKAAIELDDKSHSSEKAQAADLFKNELFKSLDLPLIRIQVKQDYTNDITSILSTLQKTAE